MVTAQMKIICTTFGVRVLLDEMYVPNVCSESLATTEYAARRKPTIIQMLTSPMKPKSVVGSFCFRNGRQSCR